MKAKLLIITIIITTALMIPTAKAENTLLNNLTAYWNFDSTGNLTDSLGILNLTKAGTPINVTGKINDAKALKGDVNYYVGDSSKLNFETGTFTVNAWVKNGTGLSNEGYNMISTGQNIAGWCTGVVGAFQLAVGGGANHGCPNSDVIMFNVYNSTTGDWRTCVPYTKDKDAWIMVTGVRNATAHKLYINGVLNVSNTSKPMTRIFSTATSDCLLIANAQDAAGTGIQDMTGVWNRELTAEEITQLYDSGNGLDYPFAQTSTVTAVTLNNPTNRTYWYSAPNLNATCQTDAPANVNMTFYLNNTWIYNINGTSPLTVNVTPTMSFEPFNELSWNVNCTSLDAALSSKVSVNNYLYYANTTAPTGNCTVVNGTAGTCSAPSGIVLSPNCQIYQSGSGAFWNIRP